jgi:4-aminobutyrate aminotransferase
MKNDTIKRARQRLTNALVFHTGITAASASGARVTSTDGVEYLDFSSGLATTNIGHCPPAVVDAVRAQAEQLIHSGCIFYYDSIVDLAERLAGITPDGIEMFFFSNSGAEAVEGAIKLARFSTGRQGIVAFTGAFHGRTTGTRTATAARSDGKRRPAPLTASTGSRTYSPTRYRPKTSPASS